MRRYRPLGRFLEGPNPWSEALPHFKEVYKEYYEAVHQSSKTMFKLVALSLGLQEDHFDYFASDLNGEAMYFILAFHHTLMSSGICLCRSHHYPLTPKDAAGRTRGVGAHTDFGALTLLLQDTGEWPECLDRACKLTNSSKWAVLKFFTSPREHGTRWLPSKSLMLSILAT